MIENQENTIAALESDPEIRKDFDGVAVADGTGYSNPVAPAVPLSRIDLGCFCFDSERRFSSARLPVVHVAHERRILPRVENR